MERLTTVYGSFEGHVVAARLRSEGLDVELRGALGGPYAVTVGELARVDVYVPADQMEEARMCLLEAEVEQALEGTTPSTHGRSWGLRLLGAALVGAALWPLLRLWLLG